MKNLICLLIVFIFIACGRQHAPTELETTKKVQPKIDRISNTLKNNWISNCLKKNDHFYIEIRDYSKDKTYQINHILFEDNKCEVMTALGNGYAGEYQVIPSKENSIWIKKFTKYGAAGATWYVPYQVRNEVLYFGEVQDNLESITLKLNEGAYFIIATQEAL
jgi:hypothetical protein